MGHGPTATATKKVTRQSGASPAPCDSPKQKQVTTMKQLSNTSRGRALGPTRYAVAPIRCGPRAALPLRVRAVLEKDPPGVSRNNPGEQARTSIPEATPSAPRHLPLKQLTCGKDQVMRGQAWRAGRVAQSATAAVAAAAASAAQHRHQWQQAAVMAASGLSMEGLGQAQHRRWSLMTVH